jgi:hypothetical protein
MSPARRGLSFLLRAQAGQGHGPATVDLRDVRKQKGEKLKLFMQ